MLLRKFVATIAAAAAALLVASSVDAGYRYSRQAGMFMPLLFSDQILYTNSPGGTIGTPVIGGTANRVLFIDGSGNLDDDAGLTYTAGPAVLTIGTTGNTQIVLNTTAPTTRSQISLRADSGADAFLNLNHDGSNSANSLFGLTLTNYSSISTGGVSSSGFLLGTQTADPFIIGTNNTERMRVLSTGAIGIGVTTPASALDIDTGSNSLGLRLRGLAETVEVADVYLDAGGPLVISTVGGVGISAWVDLRPENSSYGLVIRESDGTGTTTYANFYVADAADDYLTIGVNSGSDGDALAITATNRVGIGTLTPSARLTVDGTSAVTVPVKVVSGTGANAIQILGRADHLGYLEFFQNDGTTLEGAVYGKSGGLTITDAGATNVLTVTTGSVGIGASTPTANLDIDGAARTVTTVAQRAIVNNTNTITTNTGATAIYGLVVDEPNIVVGTATPTDSASLYISGAATEATNNYALWVDAGTTRLDGSINLERTNTAGGTTGDQTINKMAGSVNFAAAATALTVTNSLVTAASNIFVMAQTNDSTCSAKDVEPGAGSFVIRMNAACTAETRVAFWVTN